MKCLQCGLIKAGMGNPFGCWGHEKEKPQLKDRPDWITKWRWNIVPGTIPEWFGHGLTTMAARASFEASFPQGWTGENDLDLPPLDWYDPILCRVSYRLFEHRWKAKEVTNSWNGLAVEDFHGSAWTYNKKGIWKKVS